MIIEGGMQGNIGKRMLTKGDMMVKKEMGNIKELFAFTPGEKVKYGDDPRIWIITDKFRSFVIIKDDQHTKRYVYKDMFNLLKKA